MLAHAGNCNTVEYLKCAIWNDWIHVCHWGWTVSWKHGFMLHFTQCNGNLFVHRSPDTHAHTLTPGECLGRGKNIYKIDLYSFLVQHLAHWHCGHWLTGFVLLLMFKHKSNYFGSEMLFTSYRPSLNSCTKLLITEISSKWMNNGIKFQLQSWID